MLADDAPALRDHHVAIEKGTVRLGAARFDDDVANLVAWFHFADSAHAPHRQSVHQRTPQVTASRSVTSGELMMVSVTTQFMPSASTWSTRWASHSSITSVAQMSR